MRDGKILLFAFGLMLATTVGLIITSACTATQAREGGGVARTIAGTVDLPGVNEAALEAVFTEMDKRLATIEAAKAAAGTSGENMTWQEWLYALLGTGAGSIVGSAILDRRASKTRSKSRLATLSPLLQVVGDLVDKVGSQPEKERLSAQVNAVKHKLVSGA